MIERLALLAVTAHPGDELALAGTLAKYVQGGVHVALACATHGEYSPGRGEAPEQSAQHEHDLRCACARLGVNELHFLGYCDSGPNGEAADMPGALVHARAREAIRRIVHLIRTIRPQVMLTFGPDGINGHVDHVAIGELAAQAFGAAGDPAQFPVDGGPPLYAPAKLYYFGLPEGLLRLAAIPGRATPDAAIAAREDVSQFVDIKLDAARCYQEGVEPELFELLQITEPERHHLLSAEFLNLAQPQPGVDDRRDPHLFAGIP